MCFSLIAAEITSIQHTVYGYTGYTAAVFLRCFLNPFAYFSDKETPSVEQNYIITSA